MAWDDDCPDPYEEIDVNDSRFEDLIEEYMSKSIYNVRWLADRVFEDDEGYDYVMKKAIKEIKGEFDSYAEDEFEEDVFKYVIKNLERILDKLNCGEVYDSLDKATILRLYELFNDREFWEDLARVVGEELIERM